MKIIKVESCFDCKYYREIYFENIDRLQIRCKSTGKIINWYKATQKKEWLPNWCPLEDYKEVN